MPSMNSLPEDTDEGGGGGGSMTKIKIIYGPTPTGGGGGIECRRGIRKRLETGGDRIKRKPQRRGRVQFYDNLDL